MREVKPTQKPVPSSDIKDLFFNSGLLDIWATSLEHKYIDRFGNCHLTAAGMEWLFKELVEKFKVDMNTAIVAAGYITIDSFQQGADLPNNELTQRNHILRDEATGEYYRWDGDLPKTVPAGSTPQSTGGIGKGAWVSVGDASLRGDLSNANGYTNIGECQSIDELRSLTPQRTGQLVRLKSYYSDIDSGGNRFFRSVNPAGLIDNGGTIIITSSGGAWEATELYNVKLEDFGARSGVDSTDVLRRAINSPAKRITSDLDEIILTDNSVFSRSNITLDMPNTTVIWSAEEGHIPDRTNSSNQNNYRFPGIIAFRGEAGELIDQHTVTNRIFKGDSTWRCNDNSKFTEREWVILRVTPLSGIIGSEANVMTQVQGSGGAVTELRVDYKSGWVIDVGRVITYRKVSPLVNIDIRLKGVKWMQNITDSSGGGDSFVSPQSCALVSLEYVVDSRVSLGDGENHPYPMCVTYYTTRCTVSDSRTNLPRVPGSDHVVQFNNALECHALRLKNISGRHVVDFSGAAYCSVRDCGETGSRNGAFTTHGMFEHNILFEKNYGLLSIANSGALYGDSADMITVIHHFGDYLIAQAKVTNLNIEHAIFTKRAVINNDAATLIDVTVGANTGEADKGLRLVQSSSTYSKGATFISCDVILSTEAGMALPGELTQKVKFDLSLIRNFNSVFIGGTDVSFIECDSRGSASAQENKVESVRFNLRGGSLSNTGFIFYSANEQIVSIDGVDFVGQGASGHDAYIVADKDSVSSLPLVLNFKNNNITAPSNTASFKLSNATGAIRLNSTGNTQQGGVIEFQTSLPSGSYINHTGNVERGVTRKNVPTNNNNVVTNGNMIIP